MLGQVQHITVFSQMMENGSDIKYVSTTALAFMVDDGFIIR